MQQTDLGINVAMLLFMLFGIFVGLVVTVLLTVLPFWKICTKAGFPGALSLLMLIPVGNVILLFYLAFADWPALRHRQAAPGPLGPGTG